MLNREQILAAEDRPTKTVAVPEWGGEVMLQTMDGASRSEYYDLLVEHDAGAMRGVVVAMCAVDAAGQRLFTSADVPALNAKGGPALDRLFTVALKLNRLRRSDLEETEKNFESGPGAASCSASPVTSAAPSASSSSAAPPAS